MFGLKRGTVRLMPHDRKWKLIFERERKRLAKKLRGLVIDIQHVGSTAIVGIPAKPIIDISMGVPNMRSAKKLVKLLTPLGYKLRPEFGGSNTQLLFVRGPERRRTHYLHVMKYNGKMWKNDVLFRDHLRGNRSLARTYAALKKKLAKRYADDRASYTARKSKFILATIKKARKV